MNKWLDIFNQPPPPPANNVKDNIDLDRCKQYNISTFCDFVHPFLKTFFISKKIQSINMY